MTARRRRRGAAEPAPPVLTRTRTATTPFWLPAALLVLVPLLAYWPLLRSQFVNFDDTEYVLFNTAIRDGLSWAGVEWAFTTGHAANWHPLTWLSHMADVSLFGLNPAGHHATNLLLHIVNGLLLFQLLRTLTGRAGRSAWVAALFALHPAHVESFAWVAERKDVLSTAFGFATLWAYVVWVRRRAVGLYVLAVLLFALGLMAKPMLVSIPILLLLVDDWPLDRFTTAGGTRRSRAVALIGEKVPFMLLAAASSAVTFAVQRLGGAVRIAEYSLEARVENAIVSYARYLRMLVWPENLSVFYPHPGESLPFSTVALAALLLAGITAAVIVLKRRAPYLFFGWAWFVVGLLPVIGLVQVGKQAMADRYTYVPYVGLFVATAWGAAAILGGRAVLLRALAVASVLAVSVLAARQVRVWRDTETLLRNAISAAPDNGLALTNLGDYYNSVNRPGDALPHLLRARRLNDRELSVHVNLGKSLYLLGRIEEAENAFRVAARMKPTDSLVQNNLARVLFVQGRLVESILRYRASVAGAPGPEPTRRLAIALSMVGRTEAAVAELESAVEADRSSGELRELLASARAFRGNPSAPASELLRRHLAEGHREIASFLTAKGRRSLAKLHLQRAIVLLPDDAATLTDLGAIVAQEGSWDQAEKLFRRVLEISPNSALGHSNLGYVLHRAGRWDEGIAHYQEALRLDPGLAVARNNLEDALAARRAREADR